MRRKLIFCLGILLLVFPGAREGRASYPRNLEEARGYLNRFDMTDPLPGIYEMRKDDFHGFFLVLPAPEAEPLNDYEARIIESNNPYEKSGDLKFFMRSTQEREVFFGKYYDYSSLGCFDARSGFVVTPGEISAREVRGFDRKPRVFVKIYPFSGGGDFPGGSEAPSGEDELCSTEEDSEDL